MLSNNQHDQFCLACDPDETRRLTHKRAEARFFKAMVPVTSRGVTEREMCIDYKCITASSGTRCRLDACVMFPSVVIVLELDEHYHAQYPAECEVRREQDVLATFLLNGEIRPIAIVRVNPHASADWKVPIDPKIEKERHAEALALLGGLVAKPKPGIFYVGYPLSRINELSAARLCL